MFSCLQILEAFLWFVLITLLNVTLIILTLSVSRLLNLLLRLVAFLLFLNPQCLASISRWITASSSWKRFCLFAKREMRLRLGKVTVADVLAAQPVTTNLLKFMRASIKMIGVSNLQSFIASMTQKLTLSDISDESKNYLDKAGITTACLRIKSKWTAGG